MPARKKPEVREAIVAFITSYWREHGHAPGLRDIRDGCGMSSTSVVMHHLTQLERDGRVARSARVARSIRVVAPAAVDS